MPRRHEQLLASRSTAEFNFIWRQRDLVANGIGRLGGRRGRGEEAQHKSYCVNLIASRSEFVIARRRAGGETQRCVWQAPLTYPVEVADSRLGRPLTAVRHLFAIPV